MRRHNALLTILVTMLAACADHGLLASEPMGKQLDRVRKQIEEQCRASGAPPFGPNRPGQYETACLMFSLKPWEIGDTPESVFAHSIKLPPPHDKLKDAFRAGMSSQEYFAALCKVDAGEWVFRRIEGVDGIRQERPRREQIGEDRIVFYATEPVVQPIHTPSDIFDVTVRSHWNYFERRIAADLTKGMGGFYEYFDSTTRKGRVTAKAKSNFAYVSRGIRRPFDREHAIQGSEFIIFQVEPFEVLGFQRTLTYFFVDVDRRSGSRRTISGSGCPGSFTASYEFLRSVLTPTEKR